MAIIYAPLEIKRGEERTGKYRLCRYSDEDASLFTAGCSHEHDTEDEANECPDAEAAFGRELAELWVCRKNYFEGNDAQMKLGQRFTYHAPKPDQVPRYERIRAHAYQLARDICRMCPPSRETSLAITHLEDMVMWANAAIARNE